MEIEGFIMNLLNDNIQKKIVICLFLFIPLTVLLVFTYIPALKLFELSFTNWDGLKRTYDYIGFDNYIDIFRDNSAVLTLVNNLAYIIMTILQIVLGLYFAIILDSNIKGKKFFRSFVFMPYILNVVAVAYMFNYMYNFDEGPVNIILRAIGLEKYAVHWLNDTWWSNLSLSFIGLWQFTGLCMVIFLGALQSIPKELYESASIDGSNFFQNIRYITLPSIKMVVGINLFLSLNGALQAFGQPFIITKGGPGDVTKTFALNAYYIAFDFHNFGKASALGIFLLAIIILVMLLQNLFVRIGGESE